MPLAARTTLELGGAAEHLLVARDDASVVAGLEWADARGVPVTILGGGSNVVVGDAGVPGLVIVMAQRGVRYAQRGALVHVCAEAGEPWDPLVAACVARDLSGIECLSGIPGLCGAVPVQNVGAYGQEVAQTLCSVRVLDRVTRTVRELDAADCGFGYRDSAFKRNPERCVVLGVRFALALGGAPVLAYRELSEAMGGPDAQPTLAEVRETVLALRRAKSMVIDAADENRRSAGSFFTNPVLDAVAAERVIQRALERGAVSDAAQVPRFAAPAGRVKLSAGWLIEQAGFRRGLRDGHVGLSSKHALALVHHGDGSSAELLRFAARIRDGVRDAFGVLLETEPVLLGDAQLRW